MSDQPSSSQGNVNDYSLTFILYYKVCDQPFLFCYVVPSQTQVHIQPENQQLPGCHAGFFQTSNCFYGEILK